MNFIGSKTLETERLILKKSQIDEQKRLWEILCIPEINKFYLTSKFGFNWEQQKPYFEMKVKNAGNCDIFQWSIFLKENGKCIGQISVQTGSSEDPTIDDESIRGIGWFIETTEQGKGYATEAAKIVLDYMFNEVEISEIRTSAAVDNPASWRLMEKLGFIRRTEETHKVKYTYIDEPVDNYIYGLSNKEYQDFISKNQKLKKLR